MQGWAWETRIGTFRIVERADGFHVEFEDEHLDGPFRSAQHALDDLAGGHTPWPASGADPSTLGLSDDLSDWAQL